MRKRPFGVSTIAFRGRRLGRADLLAIASHGFDVVEVAAVSGHFDPSHDAAVADLQHWLAEARLDLHSVAVPLGVDGKTDTVRALAALTTARRIPVQALVVAVGPLRDAAKAVEKLAEAAAPLGVTVAVDSRSASMQPIGSLVHFVERAESRIGIALDCAIAAKSGAGLIDAIEMASEHLAAVRVPIQSAIDWSNALTTLQKVGYEGPLVVDADGRGALDSAREARERLKRLVAAF